MRIIRYNKSTGYSRWTNTKMQIAICDESVDEIRKTEHMLCDIAKHEKYGVELKGFTSGKKLLESINSKSMHVDAVILEIDMGAEDGLETARVLRKNGFVGEIFFLTKKPEYYIYAFELRAFQYILKTKGYETILQRTLTDLLHYLEEEQKKYIWVTDNKEYQQILIDDIYYIDVNQRFVTIHHKRGEFQFMCSMGRIQEFLGERDFLRIHQSYLVARRAIKSVSANVVTLADGTELPIGRTFRTNVYDDLKRIKQERVKHR